MASASTTIEELRRANAALQQERDEALAREAALAEVLAVINRSPADPSPVFDAMLERALRLCGAAFGALHTYDGERFHLVAMRGVPSAYEAFRRRTSLTAPADSPPGRVVTTGLPVQVPDVLTDPFISARPELRDSMVELGGVRATLNLPLLRDGAVVGIFVIYRAEPGVFPDKQVALLEGFAAQAVIAMENARLLHELRARTEELAARNSAFSEQIDHQSATIDVLKAMSASPGDAQPVFEQIIRRARQLCSANSASIFSFDGERIDQLTIANVDENFDHAAQHTFTSQFPMAPSRGTVVGRVILDRRARACARCRCRSGP